MWELEKVPGIHQHWTFKIFETKSPSIQVNNYIGTRIIKLQIALCNFSIQEMIKRKHQEDKRYWSLLKGDIILLLDMPGPGFKTINSLFIKLRAFFCGFLSEWKVPRPILLIDHHEMLFYYRRGFALLCLSHKIPFIPKRTENCGEKV